MILSINHKGLRLYYEEGNGSKLSSEYLRKIARILTSLDAVTSEEDIVALGSGIHKLSGDLSDFWSIKVSENYRIIFKFDNGDVFEVDYLDYH
jgi:toxin HigB-1